MAHSRHLPLYSAAYGFTKEIYRLKIKLLIYHTTDVSFQSLPPFTTPVQIFTLSNRFEKLSTTLGYRRAANVDGTTINTPLASLKYDFSSYFSATFLYNEIPGSESLGARIYF